MGVDLPVSMENVRFAQRQHNTDTISFRSSMRFTVCSNRPVSRSEKAGGWFLTPILLTEYRVIPKNLDLCFHLRYPNRSLIFAWLKSRRMTMEC